MSRLGATCGERDVFARIHHRRQIIILVGGPKNVPLMLEESGVRFATLFPSQEAIKRFQRESCALNSFQVQELDSPAAVLGEPRKTQKFGCGMLLVDPPGPEIKKQQSQVLAAFLRQLSAEPGV